MPYTAAKRLRWGDGFIEIGDSVPDNEPGRRYDLMVRYGEITGAPATPVGETAVALVTQQEPAPPDELAGMSSLPAINLETATKRELMAWIGTVTGKEPGPASKEETLRARVAEILAGHVSSTASDQGEQDGGSQSIEQDREPQQQPEQRLSQVTTSAPVMTPAEPAMRTA
ncbi:hypothetical protein ABMY26_00245 (plasmid) [Azospirillum sp. HJ39]|uniref:hypothetical protein n=1 Tax=Azospirillum sp. HJ39 TaxID=3159496 RepID=UPI003558E87C